MQKNNGSRTFLLKNSTKTKNNNYQTETYRKIFQTCIFSLILFFGIFGVSKFVENIAFAKSETNLSSIDAETAKPISNNSTFEYKSINYERPASSEDYAKNSGGPKMSFKLSSIESEVEESVMENRIRLIEATSDPAFLPTMWAHLGKINNEFGFRRNPFSGRSYEFHSGIDIGGEKGDLVAAPANGTVTEAHWQGGYGNMIEIDHGNGLKTRYGHLSKIGVQVGDQIQRGQLIGLIGSTGRSTGPHLHFELRLDDKPINPRRFLPPEPAEIRALGVG